MSDRNLKIWTKNIICALSHLGEMALEVNIEIPQNTICNHVKESASKYQQIYCMSEL